MIGERPREKRERENSKERANDVKLFATNWTICWVKDACLQK